MEPELAALRKIEEQEAGKETSPMTPSTDESVERLSGPDFDSRITAMSEVRERKDTGPVSALIRLLREDEDHRIREEAAYTKTIGDSVL